MTRIENTDLLHPATMDVTLKEYKYGTLGPDYSFEALCIGGLEFMPDSENDCIHADINTAIAILQDARDSNPRSRLYMEIHS